MRDRGRSPLGHRGTPARRWCRGELRVAPLDLALALRRPSRPRLATVIRITTSRPSATVARPSPLVRELRLEHTSYHTSVGGARRETRIETARHARLERTLTTRQSRYERVEAGAPGAAPRTRATMLVPMPAIVLARTPVAPPPAPVAAPAPTGEAQYPAAARGPAGSAAAAAVASAAPDIEAIANQVLRAIERRAIAQRERMGRG